MKYIILFLTLATYIYSKQFNKVEIELFIYTLNSTDYDVYILSDNVYKVNTSEVSIYLSVYDLPFKMKSACMEHIQDLSIIMIRSESDVYQTNNNSMIYIDIECNDNKHNKNNTKMLKGSWNNYIFKRFLDLAYIHGTCINKTNVVFRYSDTKNDLVETTLLVSDYLE
ncbi:protein C13 [BeAn 58058 virus]|uniref:protein C13 n=1 Tax=BeAn 58058 virus TaxID=67082 RepID=UPI00090B8AC6|nr:protein C13 [BeAn 58058 virus]APG58397.1 protein C13 [BeAn 58058 virus]